MNTVIHVSRAKHLCLLGFLLLGLFLLRQGEPPATQGTPIPTASLSTSIESTAANPDKSPSEPAALTQGAEAVNILLIGYDEGTGNTRSDTILLCTFRKEDQHLTMTSILRDLYVTIPGHGENRINAAYAYGGRELLKQTLETNLDITIDTTLEVDFSGFAEIVDILGGVTIDLRPEEAEAINKSTSGKLTEGTQLLSGTQALAYARIRKLDADGDFSRTARQRRLLEAMLTELRSAKPLTLLSLLRRALPLISTDVSGDSLFSLAKELLPTLRQLRITGQHIPAEGTYSYETIRGMSVLVADLEAARKLLRETAGAKHS